MARNSVRNYGADNYIHLPVSGGGSAIPIGALMTPGLTMGTNGGFLIPATGSTEAKGVMGVIQEAHATANDTNQGGTIYTTHPIDLCWPGRVVRMEYSLAAGDLITCTQAVSTTTMTVTSLEDDIDGSFVYVAVGTGAGQINFLTAAASGSCTLKAAFGTSLDTTSKFVKILRRFHGLLFLNSDGTGLASQAGASSFRGMVMDISISRNGEEHSLNPVNDSALTGLNTLASLKFYADVAIIESGPYLLA